jgi:hypothetical protein
MMVLWVMPPAVLGTSIRPSTIGRIKGAAFVEFLRFCEQKYGKDRLQSAVLSIPAELRYALALNAPALGVLPSTWYAASTVHALLDALLFGVSIDERRRMAAEISKAIMDATLRGVYRALFRVVATPQRYARHASRLWTAYYDTGQFSIQMPDDKTAIATVGDWPSHHSFICELNRGAAEAIYTAMGLRGVTTTRAACIDGGAPNCRFVSRWR